MSDLAADSPFSPWRFISSGTLLTFGVALPIGALFFELRTHFCAQGLFDPIPTFAHVILIASVIAANAWACYVVTRERFSHAVWAARAIGFAIGISAYYTVLFAPIVPIAAAGFIYYHWTVLAFAPVSALVVALRFRVHLRRRAKDESIQIRTWPSILVGLAALAVLDTPETITRITARMADGNRVETRARGMHLLRMFGSERVLLRMCYQRTASFLDIAGVFLHFEHSVDTGTARTLYYRMTGRVFNSVPAPVNLHRERGMWFDEAGFDSDQGGEQVGQQVKGLSLASSRLDGSVSADAALGYLEWTLVFSNKSDQQHEARAQIALPPGAVVSRLTLWIDGEEREAAFAGRRQVRQAYENVVVRQRRDPVLVTNVGPDRVLMQLFPVPPSGTMKVRVGITIPLRLTDSHDGILYMPYFQEKNFGIDSAVQHAVWIESTSRLRGTHVSLRTGDKANIFRAEVSDSQLTDASIVTMRGGQSVAWAIDSHGDGQIVRQQISDEPAGPPPPQLVLVVDGSSSMEGAVAPIARALSELPPKIEVRLVFAHDEADQSIERRVLSGAAAAKEIESFDYDGGHDNAPALSRGMDIAGEQPNSVLVWIHGPQPVPFGIPAMLAQQLVRDRTLGPWYEMQVVPGQNRVTEELEATELPEALRAEEFVQLIGNWRPGARRVAVTRERISGDARAMPVNQKTSDHLVRLWASDEIGRMIHDPSVQRSAAIEMAQRYQLVTPVSGAVVLETQQQYDAAGLQPVPEGTVPSIPEPEEWALIVAALVVLLYAYQRRRAFAV